MRVRGYSAVERRLRRFASDNPAAADDHDYYHDARSDDARSDDFINYARSDDVIDYTDTHYQHDTGTHNFNHAGTHY